MMIIVMMCTLVLSGCEDDPSDPMSDPTPDPNVIDPNDPEPTTEYTTGWAGDDDLETVPTATTFGFSNTNLPTSTDLTEKFPPIGDQGQYGTCVAWALGYNLKTALTGMDKNFSTSDLAITANQFSPKDLFTAIPDMDKSPDCDGTSFTVAFDVLINRGVATMQTVPYSSLDGCSQANLQGNWTNEAGQNKIQYYRKIEPSIQIIKQNLVKNIPVVLGAKLADNFMTWDSDEVLTSNTTFDNVGIHAYHALVIAGYDDSKGPGGAFKVINSWGDSWGDQGYIWIDYDFLINEFCTSGNGDKPLFIAANAETISPTDDPDDIIDPVSSGVDLAPWVFSDISTYQYSGSFTERQIDFNVYNIGNQAATANDNWSYYYIYYNAYDVNDYGVLFYDEFNTTVDPNTFYCETGDNCVFNISIESGNNFSTTAWGYNSINRTYYMPEITGSYYLVLIVDAYESFQEQDELNNFFYTTMQPKYFQGGYGERRASPTASDFNFENKLAVEKTALKRNDFNTSVNEKFRNAYRPDEVLSFLKHEKKNGNLAAKVNEFVKKQDTQIFQK